MTEATETFEQWAIVEIMGHRRLGGLVTEVERFGTKMMRVDIPPAEVDGQTITQFYGGSSIYALTVTDEETARAFALARRELPIDAWSARRMLETDDRRQTANAQLEIDEAAFLGETDVVDDEDPEL